VIVTGHATCVTWLRVAVNYTVPYLVASVGFRPAGNGQTAVMVQQVLAPPSGATMAPQTRWTASREARSGHRRSSHPRYGRQFEVHSYATVLPATERGHAEGR
jgi:hypothetical protein